MFSNAVFSMTEPLKPYYMTPQCGVKAEKQKGRVVSHTAFNGKRRGERKKLFQLARFPGNAHSSF